MIRFWGRTSKSVEKAKQIVNCNKTVQGVTGCADYLTSSVNSANYDSINNFLTNAKSTSDSLKTIISSVSELMDNFQKWEGKSKDNFQQVKTENSRLKRLFEDLNITIEDLQERNESAKNEYNAIINTWESHKSETESGNTIINHGNDINLRA